MYFAPVVCNLFKGSYKINVYFSESTCMSKKCTQKEFGNLLEYIALGNQCKKDVLNSIQRNIGAECLLFCVFQKFI